MEKTAGIILYYLRRRGIASIPAARVKTGKSIAEMLIR